VPDSAIHKNNKVNATENALFASRYLHHFVKRTHNTDNMNIQQEKMYHLAVHALMQTPYSFWRR